MQFKGLGMLLFFSPLHARSTVKERQNLYMNTLFYILTALRDTSVTKQFHFCLKKKFSKFLQSYFKCDPSYPYLTLSHNTQITFNV